MNTNFPLDKSWCADIFPRKNYTQDLNEWQLKSYDPKGFMTLDSSSKQRVQNTEGKFSEDHCSCTCQKCKGTSKKDRRKCKAGRSSDHSRSSSESSGEITININLKKSALLGRGKTSKTKEATINIQTDLHESEEEPKKSQVANPLVEKPAAIPPPVVKEIAPQNDLKAQVEVKDSPKLDSGNELLQSKPETAIDLSSFNLGAKLLETSKVMTVKPKAAKTYANIDKMLYDLIVQLTSKSITDDIKNEAIKKFENQSPKKFFKVMLTPKGREQELEATNEMVSKLKSSAIKLYTIENEQKPLVGAVVWEEESNLSWIDREIFKVDLLQFSNPDDEKEIVKSLKLCLKTKELEL